jgi:hypothetical protein
MRVLFDKSAPNKLTRHLEGHAVSKAEKQGWDRLGEDGEIVLEAPLPAEEMKPLRVKAQEGRANPKGIPRLYIAS